MCLHIYLGKEEGEAAGEESGAALLPKEPERPRLRTCSAGETHGWNTDPSSLGFKGQWQQREGARGLSLGQPR